MIYYDTKLYLNFENESREGSDGTSDSQDITNPSRTEYGFTALSAPITRSICGDTSSWHSHGDRWKVFFRPVGMLVINQSSEHQKEISEFLEALLSVQNQTKDLMVMSVRKDAAEYGIVRQTKYKADGTEDGEQWMWRNGNNTYTRIDFDGTKEDLCEAYASFAQSMVAADSSGKEVSGIVWQEIETYLEGKKSARATVETIDRRVQLYFDER